MRSDRVRQTATSPLEFEPVLVGTPARSVKFSLTYTCEMQFGVHALQRQIELRR